MNTGRMLEDCITSLDRYHAAIKEWADAHDAMPQQTRGIAPGDDRLWKAEKALKALVEGT